MGNLSYSMSHAIRLQKDAMQMSHDSRMNDSQVGWSAVIRGTWLVRCMRSSSCHCNTQENNALQHTATHCNTLQHNASHCNTLQHTDSFDVWDHHHVTRVRSLSCHTYEMQCAFHEWLHITRESFIRETFHIRMASFWHMGWLQLVGSLKL